MLSHAGNAGRTHQEVFVEETLVEAAIPPLLVQPLEGVAALLHPLERRALAADGHTQAPGVHDARGQRARGCVWPRGSRAVGGELRDERAETRVRAGAARGRGRLGRGWRGYWASGHGLK